MVTLRPLLPCLVLLLAGQTALSPVSAAAAAVPAAPSAYDQEIAQWHAERIARLERKDGWLTLAGLYWLEPGDNPFGSDPSNKIDFPAGKAPAHAGSFRLADGKVSIEVAPGAGVTSDGKPVTSMALSADDSAKPAVLHLGSLSFFVIRRGDKLGLRLKDSESPVLAAFHGIDTFPVDPHWRVVARLERHDPPRTVPIPNVLGQVSDEPSPGTLVFELGGATYRLDPIAEEGSDGLFLIFADKTSGLETYGAGRFLDLPGPDAEGKVVVDFNQAYNPPCVFTPYATCPLPPRQNRLPIRVEAGEKTYGTGHGH